MKTNLSILLLISLFYGLQSFAQDDTIIKESFKVWGNCEMCKSKIEKAVKSIDGVSYAKWSVAKKRIVVKYDNSKTSIEKIHEKIASVGYDTELIKAKDETYNKLHGCCQYERD